MQFKKKLTNNFILKKYFSITLLGAFLGIAICFFLIYSEQQQAAVYKIENAFLAGLCGVVVALIISQTSYFFNRILPWQTQTGNRLFVGFTTHFIISFLLVSVFFYIYQILFFSVDNFIEEFRTTFIKLAIILLILTLVFEVIYFALYSYYSYAKFQIETVKQERKQIELQLKALKSQLSPHFLFNSLNTISSLIYKDENKAETFIRRLAKMYDYTLKSYHQKLITLKEELAFVESYKYLVQTRFQDKFICKINISDDVLLTKIPPLTIQMLVENAVKHNQLSIEKPLEINIFTSDNHIIIENNITEIPTNVVSFNIGLKNINTRYLILINKAISVVRANNFTVKLPIIR
jgi:sensor histidine kinase YesM